MKCPLYAEILNCSFTVQRNYLLVEPVHVFGSGWCICSTGKVLELLGSCNHVTSVYNVNVMWCLRAQFVGEKQIIY